MINNNLITLNIINHYISLIYNDINYHKSYIKFWTNIRNLFNCSNYFRFISTYHCPIRVQCWQYEEKRRKFVTWYSHARNTVSCPWKLDGSSSVAFKELRLSRLPGHLCKWRATECFFTGNFHTFNGPS